MSIKFALSFQCNIIFSKPTLRHLIVDHYLIFWGANIEFPKWLIVLDPIQQFNKNFIAEKYQQYTEQNTL